MKKFTLALAIAIALGFVAYRHAAAQIAPTTRPAGNFSQQFNDNQRNNRRDRRRNQQEFQGNRTQQSSHPAQMTDKYGILTSRSIFFKGHFQPPVQGQPLQVGPPPDITNTTFNGLTTNDYGDKSTIGAWLENTTSGSVEEVHVGDIFQGGHITKIDMFNNTIDFTMNGRTTTLYIGQNLAGEQVYGINASGSSSSTQPTVDLSGPNADVLKKLMARRQAELNGGK